ncbi:uncharacterized protein LOC135471339 isoform X2 [Liolophura sinensis]|uniref:uncharacterized protein LOC135471339 isoform X2 n=1 Tax=Liolophura sinensis TaxID=3198878 RepID=UPI00315867A3
MMDFKSFCMLFLVSLVIASCFCQSNGLSSLGTTGKCEPRDCSEQGRFPGDHSFPCLIGHKNECDRFNVQPARKPTRHIVPPRIAAVNVYQRYYPKYNKSFPVLNVTLILPNDVYSLNRTKAVKLSILDVSRSDYNYCRLFDFRNATFTEKDAAHPRLLRYPCFTGLDEEYAGTFRLSVVALPDKYEVEYYATVQTLTGKWKRSLLVWQPVGKKELQVMFERQENIREYRLTLYSYNKSDTFCGNRESSRKVQTKFAQNGSNTGAFKAEDNPKYMYFITITPLNCDPPCDTLTSYCLSLKGISDNLQVGKINSEEVNTEPDSPKITRIGPGNDQATKTVLGVICGVVGGGLLVVLIIYLYGKKGKYFFISPAEPGRGVKQETTVLLLYSFDCTQHKNVVERLAFMLRQTFDFIVHFDLFELQQIDQISLLIWLQEKIDMSDFIIFVCSTGGRVQCNPSIKRLQLNENHPVENYFCTAVEKVTNIWREFKVPQENIAVVTMSYSNNGDIPAKLDRFHRFRIKHRKDLAPLYCYLKHTDKMPQDLQFSDDVEAFFSALQEANTYFEKNPEWIYKLLDKSYVDNKTPAPSSKRSKKAAAGPRLNNADVDQHCIQSDWCLHHDNKIISNQWSSQPNSIHSSESSCRYNMISSRSHECLSKKSMVEDLEAGACLLSSSRLRQGEFTDSDDSDGEETPSKNIPTSVDFHFEVRDSCSDSPGTQEYTSDSDSSDLLKNVENIHHGPNTEKIRKIVSPSYNYTPRPPICPWQSRDNHISSIPMVLRSPMEIHYCDPDNASVYLDMQMSDHQC